MPITWTWVSAPLKPGAIWDGGVSFWDGGTASDDPAGAFWDAHSTLWAVLPAPIIAS